MGTWVLRGAAEASQLASHGPPPLFERLVVDRGGGEYHRKGRERAMNARGARPTRQPVILRTDSRHLAPQFLATAFFFRVGD